MTSKKPLRVLINISDCFKGYSKEAVDLFSIFSNFHDTKNIDTKALLIRDTERKKINFDSQNFITNQTMATSYYVANFFNDKKEENRQAFLSQWFKIFSCHLRKKYKNLYLLRTEIMYDFLQKTFSKFRKDVLSLLNTEVFGTHFDEKTIKKNASTSLPLIPLQTKGIDVVISPTPFLLNISKETLLIIRHYDLSELLITHTAGHEATKRTLFNSIVKNKRAYFICSSQTEKKRLISSFPGVTEERTAVIPICVGDYFYPDNDFNFIDIFTQSILFNPFPDKPISIEQEQIYEFQKGNFILFVGKISPSSNLDFLLEALETYNQMHNKNLKLLVVGNFSPISTDFVDKITSSIHHKRLLILEETPTESLRKLYTRAFATICPETEKGYALSGIESMKCGTPVLASDIPINKELFQSGAFYFNPYKKDSLINTLHKIQCLPKQEHEKIVSKGVRISRLHSKENTHILWQKCLEELTGKSLEKTHKTEKRSVKKIA